MKQGSHYAKRIKQLFQQMVRQHGKPALDEPAEPLEQMLVGILAENAALNKAAACFKRVCQSMVDLNELRVTPPMELTELIGTSIPMAREKADRLVAALNAIRQRQDTLDLSFLKQRGRREAREYLESIEGVGRSAAAWVVVNSLGGHAIPVDDLTLYVLRKEEVVDPSADAAEVQGFLERHISAADCRVFATLLNAHVAHAGSRVTVSRLYELLNPAASRPPEAAHKGDAQTVAGDGAHVSGEHAPTTSAEAAGSSNAKPTGKKTVAVKTSAKGAKNVTAQKTGSSPAEKSSSRGPAAPLKKKRP